MLNVQSIADANETDAMPQAAGIIEERRNELLRKLMRNPSGRVLVHTEKRGPAFDAAFAVRRLMGALERGVFLDVIPAWTDLLAALNLKPSPLSLSEAYWPQMVDAINAALLGSTGPDAELLWAKADEAVRGYAKVAAIGWDNDAKRAQGFDHWDDLEADTKAEVIHAHSQAARLRAFAKAAA